MDRAADQAEGFAELVLEEAAVGEVERVVHVREERERWGRGLELRGVVEAARAATHGWRLVCGDGALQDLIQLRGRETFAVAGHDLVDARKDLLDTASGLRGNELDGRVRQELQLETDLLFHLLVIVLRVRGGV